MSLFPAYSKADDKTPAAVPETWLQNASFDVPFLDFKPREPAPDTSSSSDADEEPRTDSKAKSDSSDDSERHARKRKKKDKMKKKKKSSKKEEVLETDSFIVDRKRDLAYLNMERQTSLGRPKYEKPLTALPGVREAKIIFSRRKKPKRYFSRKETKTGQDDVAVGEELKTSVAELNKAVHDDPRNVSNWLRLVAFQEDYFKFQAIQFKTSGDRDRAITSQKLAILERAIAANPTNEEVQKAWLDLVQQFSTADEVHLKVAELLSLGGDSLVMGVGRVMLTQQSMPRCSSRAVIKAYSDVMDRVQRLRHLTGEKQDNQTIELLWHACVFLQQSGLWEMAMLVLTNTLTLNVAVEVPLVCADDKAVLAEENKILEASAGVQIWHLWSRLENLRQSHHFQPVLQSSSFPQRVVAAREVAGLMHTVRPEGRFRLLTLIPLLAKVPLLPRRHGVLAALATQLTPWLLDGVEAQLAAVLPASPLLRFSTDFLTNHLPASPSPQFLTQQSGQKEFLNLAMESFRVAIDACEGRNDEQVALGVWYLRFLRWLDCLARTGRYKPPDGFPKTKDLFKEFLGREENRKVPLYFIEFAVWELDAGNADKSLKTLMKIKESRMIRNDLTTKEDLESGLVAFHRTLCEIQVILGQHTQARDTLTETSFSDICGRCSVFATYKDRPMYAVDPSERIELDKLLMPNWWVDYTTCYGLFLALKGNAEAGALFLEEKAERVVPFIKEMLLESAIGIRRHFRCDKLKSEVPVAVRLLKEFPLNATASNVLADTLVNGGGLWWKELAYLVTDANSLTAAVAVCCLLERQQRHGGQDNRCKALLDKLTGPGNRTTALVHRMNLSRLATSTDSAKIAAARVLALESAPWDKSLYMDCISLTPTELIPLTDLIVEKDLRIHITPDEIEALRD